MLARAGGLIQVQELHRSIDNGGDSESLQSASTEWSESDSESDYTGMLYYYMYSLPVRWPCTGPVAVIRRTGPRRPTATGSGIALAVAPVSTVV